MIPILFTKRDAVPIFFTDRDAKAQAGLKLRMPKYMSGGMNYYYFYTAAVYYWDIADWPWPWADLQLYHGCELYVL